MSAARSLQDLLNERDRLTSEFDAHFPPNAPTDDAEFRQHCHEVHELDRAILERDDPDASPADLVLQAEHAISFLDLPEDEAGETGRLPVLAVRALKNSILQLATALGRRPA